MSTLAQEAKSVCASLALHPARHRGQNFCISQRVLDSVAQAADLKAGEMTLEIGPGLGFLTSSLLATGAKVIAVELQKEFVGYMREKFVAENNLTIVQDDALDFLDNLNDSTNVIAREVAQKRPTEAIQKGVSPLISGLLREYPRNDEHAYTAVGMVPYNITSRLFRVLLESPKSPRQIVFVIQKDVAERMSAEPGEMNMLSVSCQYLAKVEVLSKISAENFWPKPQVDSALVRLTPKKVALVERKLFFKVLHAGFAHKRKKVISNFSEDLSIPKKEVEDIFNKLKIRMDARAESFTVEQWQTLTNEFVNCIKK